MHTYTLCCVGKTNLACVGMTKIFCVGKTNHASVGKIKILALERPILLPCFNVIATAEARSNVSALLVYHIYGVGVRAVQLSQHIAGNGSDISS